MKLIKKVYELIYGLTSEVRTIPDIDNDEIGVVVVDKLTKKKFIINSVELHQPTNTVILNIEKF